MRDEMEERVNKLALSTSLMQRILHEPDKWSIAFGHMMVRATAGVDGDVLFVKAMFPSKDVAGMVDAPLLLFDGELVSSWEHRFQCPPVADDKFIEIRFAWSCAAITKQEQSV